MEFLYMLEGLRNPILNALFLFITKLGEQEILILLFCITFWCINKRKAYVMGMAFFVSGLMVQGLKIIFRVPRPWVAYPEFRPIEGAVKEATGYAFPSGHTQTGAALWGSLGVFSKKKVLRILCFAIALLIGFSRLFLGVHYPADVIVSLLITFVVVFLANKFVSEEPISKKREAIRSGVVLGASIVVFIIVGILYRGNLTEYSQLVDATKAAGAGVGLALGMYIERNYIKFSIQSKNIPMHILKVILGVIGSFAIQEGLKFFGSGIVFDAFRYFVIVAWITMVYPLIIRKFFSVGK